MLSKELLDDTIVFSVKWSSWRSYKLPNTIKKEKLRKNGNFQFFLKKMNFEEADFDLKIENLNWFGEKMFAWYIVSTSLSHDISMKEGSFM